MYTGWVVRHDLVANKTYAVIFDSTTAYAPEVDKQSAEKDNVSGGVSAGVQTEDCDPAHEHTSVVCRIYKGMAPARHIWRTYSCFCTALREKSSCILHHCIHPASLSYARGHHGLPEARVILSVRIADPLSGRRVGS